MTKPLDKYDSADRAQIRALGEAVTMAAEPDRTPEALYLAESVSRPLTRDESRGPWKHPAPRRGNPWGWAFAAAAVFWGWLLVEWPLIGALLLGVGLWIWAGVAVWEAIQSQGDW